MTRVLFDHQVFSWQRYGGISRYIANLHYGIQDAKNIDSTISTLYSKNYYIRDYKTLLGNQLGKLILNKDKRRNKWNKYYSRYIIGKGNFDVLHPTFYNPYFLKNLNRPYVITVHDMIHELMPEFFMPNEPVPKQKRLCIEKASHIIAISETTKKDLIRFLNVDERKISIVHHGFSTTTNEHSVNTGVNTEKSYLLYVGDRVGYKNFTNFITAIAPLLLERENLVLICAGGGVFQSAEIELLSRLKLTQKVNQISASEDQLNTLYANATAFVFPSLYEGFGLPILEAFAKGCAVIASDNACFKEIIQGAGAFFDPHSHSNMLDTIKSVVDNKELRNTLISRGKERLSDFSMQACLEKTIQVYQNV